MKIDVLDHGYCRMTSYTQPIPLPAKNDHGDYLVRPYEWTGDLEIVRAARTSYNADWRSGMEGTMLEKNAIVQASKDEKLINYLWSHRHTTPFEAMVFTFEVQAPLFVFRQWHRHRTWSYNEVSARYTELPDLFYVPKPDNIGKQSKTNKQGRDTSDVDREWAEDKEQYIRSASKLAYDNYKVLLASGVSRELARLVLPLNVYSRMFATVDLLNLFRFLELRLDPHAQYEIRVYADALLRLVQPICPVATQAFKDSIGYTGDDNEG